MLLESAFVLLLSVATDKVDRKLLYICPGHSFDINRVDSPRILFSTSSVYCLNGKKDAEACVSLQASILFLRHSLSPKSIFHTSHLAEVLRVERCLLELSRTLLKTFLRLDDTLILLRITQISNR